jgi:hypothetical protein
VVVVVGATVVVVVELVVVVVVGGTVVVVDTIEVVGAGASVVRSVLPDGSVEPPVHPAARTAIPNRIVDVRATSRPFLPSCQRKRKHRWLHTHTHTGRRKPGTFASGELVADLE